MSQRADRPNFPELEVRLLWTLCFVAVSIVGTRVMLPGINVDARAALDRSTLSVVALGLMPFITGTFLVEVLALLVPRWRPLRYGGLASRRQLRRAALVVTLVTAVVQAHFLVVWLRNTTLSSSLPPIWDAGPGMLQQALLVVTLAAGVFALLALAASIERLGVGSGISVLIAGGQLWSWAGQLRVGVASSGGDLPTPIAQLLTLLVLGAVVVSTALVLRRRTPVGVTRLPVCGLTPLPVAASLTMLPATLGMFNLAVPPFLSVPPAWFNLGLVVALGFALSAVLPREEQSPADKSWASGERWGGAAMSTAYLLALWGAQRLLGMLQSGTAVDVLAVAVVTAVALDLAAEGSLRRAHGPLCCVGQSHSVAAAEGALSALRAADVPAVTRGLYHRSLWRFFAPYVDLDILVPESLVERAQQILGTGPLALLVPAAGTKLPPAAPPLSPTTRRALILLPVLVLIWLLAGLSWRYAPTAQLVLATELDPSLSAAQREAALAQNLAVVQTRLSALRIWPVWARQKDDQILIRFPRRDAPAPSVLVTTLTRDARLEFKLAEVGGDYLTRLSAWAEAHQAEYPGLRAQLDRQTRFHDGRERRDQYLSGPNRALLQRFLRDLPTELLPPADRELVLEPVRSRFDEEQALDGQQTGPSYRTHLLHRTPILTGQDIADARSTLPPGTGQPAVEIIFTAAGATRFGDFTAAHIGDRLAIVLNGEVSSAPVIQSAIRGGRAHITLGNHAARAPASGMEDAQSLAAALRSGALAAPLRVVSF